MWDWLVFVASSVSCVHLGFEMARRLMAKQVQAGSGS
jgi:hypothetical protein